MDANKSLSELDGAVVLFKRANCADVLEGTVQGLSADGKYVKLDKSGKWYPAADISVLEVLEEARKPKTAKAAAVKPAEAPAQN